MVPFVTAHAGVPGLSQLLNLPKPAAVDFGALSVTRLGEMAAAGDEILECCRVLARTSDNIVGEVLRDQGKFYQWNHYPGGDVFDHETHSQYYYHSHERPDEHGHFHTFLRPKGMPPGIKPAPVPDLELPEEENEALSHLIAISMDEFGVPIRLFTTNRWVTGEIWYAAADVRAMLDRFLIDHARPSWPVNRWIGAMIRLYRPHITALIDARDGAMAAWQDAYPDRNAFEDRELEITSVMEISVDEQIAEIRRALAAKA